MVKQSKRMKEVYQGVDKEKLYPLTEALGMIKERAKAKFDETIELSVQLNVDTRKAEQNVRGAIILPHGTGKILRVAVFAKDSKAEEARSAGADVVGAEDLADSIKSGVIDFDRCIATPDLMLLVGTLGKILGPKGLMPNPKVGTVTAHIAEAVKAAKGGQIEYRAEKTGIVQAGVGKASFSPQALQENVRVLTSALMKAKPEGIKGSYVLKASLSSTMGPSLKLSLADLL